MQTREDEIRRETDRLISEAGERHGCYHLYCEAETLFIIPATDYTNEDWLRLAKIKLGKTISGNIGEEQFSYHKQAIASISRIPISELTPAAKQLLAECHYRYYSDQCCWRDKNKKSIFPTNLAKQHYLEPVMNVLTSMSFEGVPSEGFYYLARMQLSMGDVLVENYDWISAKSFYNAALLSCKRNGSFPQGLISSIYNKLWQISVANSLERELYHYAQNVFTGTFPIGFSGHFSRFLSLHLAIVQQPYMHLTPVAHALLLLMQIMDHSLMLEIHNQSNHYSKDYEAEKRAALKTMMIKLAADLKPASLLKMTAESGGFVVGVATKLDELERKIELAQSRFVLFSQEPQQSELSPPNEMESDASCDTTAPAMTGS